ncbi:TIGR02710 family CRISPR-associated CARF protein [Rhodothermus marinus]|uniref:TIGR02710 family CRISPR-associated CARF protein n=1 Tax=Rhodothermus marinus TaxID=29549 RepID=UPI000AF000F5|nr:TIGR02710 family CRISPR-associated CARF protein [Rhodothermus marinus]
MEAKSVHKILIISVGGSIDPVVSSIQKNRPDRIVFVCSDDLETTPGSYRLVSQILNQAGATDCRYEVIRIKEIDDLNVCYTESLRIIERERREFVKATLIVDYTGGTKSMSAGLAAAAMDVPGVFLCVMKGLRADLKQVQAGTQRLRLSSTDATYVQRQERLLVTLLRRYDYAAAKELIDQLIHTPDLPPEIESRLQRRLILCQAFDSWDKFDHITAKNLLEPYRKDFYKRILFLENIWRSLALLKGEMEATKLPEKMHGFEAVEDLLLNAERRAHQQRFDDAVARLYRAIELAGQLLLKIRYGLDTGRVDIARLPEALQARYAEQQAARGKVQLALVEAYTLLAELDAGCRSVWERWEKALKNLLQLRNYSILAHGFKPISQDDYERIRAESVEFIGEMLRAANVPWTDNWHERQLPVDL